MRRLGLRLTFFSYLHNISGADLRWRAGFNTDKHNGFHGFEHDLGAFSQFVEICEANL